MGGDLPRRGEGADMARSAGEASILVEGRNCWRIETADRAAVIVDAADYFVAAKQAMLAAKHCIYLLGWDFDTRMTFEPGAPTLEGPNKLGPFLRWLDRHRPEVEVYVLKWDTGALLALGRGTTPLAMLDWITSRRIHFKLDGMHPMSAAHHQKIVVVDDRLAFCGGIDMTTDRWDTRAHRDRDPRRRRPSGRRYDPWHDATVVVDGEVAAALGDLARRRWQAATGEAIVPPPARDALWPDGIVPMFHAVPVAIARTLPEHGDCAEVREIEALYLDAIAAARRSIYVESQYFASRRIAEALAARLREADGPDVVVVNPETSEGFLEEITMDTGRSRLVAFMREADVHGRFRIFSPVTAAGVPIYVHAKILVIDDRLLRVGSSNLNNRSMGFDTECDLAIEASGDTADAAVHREIARFRNGLLAEHLGVETARLDRALDEAGGSLVAAVERLRSPGRSLVPLRPKTVAALAEPFTENAFLDPERPPRPLRMLLRRIRHGARTRR
ncbi:phospholipase D-like domain-containing protein [Rhizobium sp. TRM95111]|uniref:phospholipase D-like domain-containing protein n=1 Tax=Rhizobium alarense TaxID=2846851 RepID=UPI001F40E156|nr:phospholipase D-like domain-containing protein [Rhizobium alarense]MCF3641208.1 phospholipase D-like domain-containing protein [Rhizobium alarense]